MSSNELFIFEKFQVSNLNSKEVRIHVNPSISIKFLTTKVVGKLKQKDLVIAFIAGKERNQIVASEVRRNARKQAMEKINEIRKQLKQY